MKMKKRFLGILLSLVMVLGMSLMALAWDGDPYAALLNTTTAVKFDGKQWYLIENNSTALNAGTVTLLSKECVGASVFGSNNTYSGSTVESTVKNYYDNSISSNVKSAIVDSKMFLLTTAQAKTIWKANPEVLKCNKASGANDNYWWLCSPGDRDSLAACVYGAHGHVDGTGFDVPDTLGVRPALKLNLESVIFSSESNAFSVGTPKSPAAVTTAPTAKTLTYNGSGQELVTAGTASGGTMQYALGTDATTAPTEGWGTSIPAKTDAGTYYVWYKVAGDDNHADTTAASIVVTVSKANSSVTTAPIAKSLTYNEKAQELVTAGSANGGVIEYALGTVKEATEPYTTSIPKGTDAGTYYVWYFVAGDKNHYDTNLVCITVTIGKPGVEKPADPTPAAITRDAFSGVNETIRISAKGTAVVKSVEDNGRNTLKVTGMVNQNGTTYAVSRFASNSFSDVDATTITIDLMTSGNEQRVTFASKAFNGSGTEKLKLKLTSASQVKFKSGAFSGSEIKKVVVSGLNNKGFKKVQKNLRASGYKGKIVKK